RACGGGEIALENLYRIGRALVGPEYSIAVRPALDGGPDHRPRVEISEGRIAGGERRDAGVTQGPPAVETVTVVRRDLPQVGVAPLGHEARLRDDRDAEVAHRLQHLRRHDRCMLDPVAR